MRRSPLREKRLVQKIKRNLVAPGGYSSITSCRENSGDFSRDIWNFRVISKPFMSVLHNSSLYPNDILQNPGGETMP